MTNGHQGESDRIILVHRQGNDSVTVERQTWGRADREPSFMVRIEPHDVLDAGYDEAVVRLDQQSIDRLRHWLLTGVALTRDVDVPDGIEWGIEYEGKFIALDHDVEMSRETAESALGEALDCGADPANTFVASRRVAPWVRIPPAVTDAA